MNTEAGGTIMTLSLDAQDVEALKLGLAHVEK